MNFLRTLQLVGIAAALCLLTAGPAFAQSLTLSLTEPGGSTFYPGEPVPIEGTLAYGSVGIGGAVVTVEILNPSAALFRHGTATTDSDGDFAFTVDMPFNAPLGTYTVNAYYAGLKATSTFVLSASALSVSPTSWTIGQYGYVEQGDSVPDQVFELTNSAGSPHSATVTFPSFISFGSNPSGFSVNVLAGDTVLLVADDVDTGSVGDFYGEIVIDSATNGVIHIPVSMKVRSSLAPVVEVDPGSWVEETTRNAYTVESFNVANTGTEGVDVSVSESIPRITILDSWASSFYLPPDSSMTFRAQAETSEKVTISGNILVQPSGLSTIYIPVSVTITNDPPTVSITSPSDGSTVSGTTTISLTGSDPDDDPLTFSITLVDLNDPSNRSSFSGSSYAWNTQQSPEGPYRILGNVTDGNYDVWDSIEVDVVHNRPPTASTPSAAKISGSHSFKVSSSVSDPDGDTVTGTLYHRTGTGGWSTRGMSGTAPGTYTATITTSDYSVGTTVQFYVRVQDPSGAFYETSTSSYVVPNTPPVVGTPVISPSAGHSFIVTASVGDGESDSLNAILRHRAYGSGLWNQKAMGITGTTATGTISTDDGYAPGELVEVQVLCNDPYTTSTSAIRTGTIANEGPEISSIQETPGAGHTLQIAAEISDPEDDELASVELLFRPQGGTFASKDMSSSGGPYSATIGPSDGLPVGTTLEYRIVATDQFGAEEETSVRSTQLGNQNPSVGTPTYTDSPNQHSFTVSFIVSDIDGDAIQSAMLKHRIFGTATWTSTQMSVQGGIASLTLGIQNGYLPIHTVELQVEVEDEYGGTTTSPVHTRRVPNKAPRLDSLEVVNQSGEHLTILAVQTTDPEGDQIVQVLLSHRAVGSEEWIVKTMALAGQNASTSLGTADGYAPTDLIEFTITIGDQYGASSVSPVQTLGLPNSPPSATKPTFFPRAGHKLDVRSNLADVEGDSVTAVLQHRKLGSTTWKESDMVVQGGTARVTIATTDGYLPNQGIQFRVLVTDQFEASSLSQTTDTTMPNMLPVPGELVVEDVDGTHDFHAQIAASDEDGDRLFPMCYFREVNETEWSTRPVADRVKISGELGLTYEVKFRVSDGYDEVFSEIITHQAPNSGPEISITGPANGAVLSGIEYITTSHVDAEGDPLDIQIAIDGEVVSTADSYTWITYDVPDAWYMVVVTATDGYLSDSDSARVQVDNTPVEITGIGLSRQYIKVGDELLVIVNMTDFAGVASANIDIEGHDYALRDDGLSGDGAAGDGTFGALFDLPDVTEGNRTITILATDRGGNSVEDDAEIAVDKTDPVIVSILTSRNFTSMFNPFFNVTVGATDNYDVRNITFGGILLNATGGSWTGTIQSTDAEGTYTYEVEAYDLAGRNTLVTYGPFVVDNTQPSLTSSGAEPDLADAGDTIQITVESADSLAGLSGVTFALVSHSSEETTHFSMPLFDDGEHGDGAAGDGVHGNSFVLNETLADGNYTMLIVSTDRSGNAIEDRSSHIIVDNTPPGLELELPAESQPVGEGFGIKVTASDANGIQQITIRVNESIVVDTESSTYEWVPALPEILGRSNVTVTAYDNLRHNTSRTTSLWVIDDDTVMTGSGDGGGMEIYVSSQGRSLPVEVVTASYLEYPSRKNNYTAKLDVTRASGKWGYFEINVESNSTILFLADSQGTKLPEDQWWEVNQSGARTLYVTDLSPETYTIQFEPPPRAISWSLMLKIALAVLLVGLSYAVVTGRVPTIPARLPARVPREERPMVPRPIEIPPAGEERPRRPPARGVQIRIPEAPPRAPTQPPTKPPTRPPTQPPTKPPTKPPTQPPTKPPTRPPTQPPTKPPWKPEHPPKRVVPGPRPAMPEKPYVPEKPRAPEKMPEGSPTGSLMDGLKALFRRRRRGL